MPLATRNGTVNSDKRFVVCRTIKAEVIDYFLPVTFHRSLIYSAMPRRLKITVAYDGTGFAGWQSQSHRNTIQDHLERAFERISGKPARVHGAGRTDAGV